MTRTNSSGDPTAKRAPATDGDTASETETTADTDRDTAADADGDAETEHADEGTDPDDDSLCASVITISTERSLEADDAGEAIVTALKKDGHEVATREHIDTDHDRVQSIVSRMIDRNDIDIIITGGATSVEPDDVTIEAVEPLLDKELTAFSELFTALSYEAVGSRVVTARTLAGVGDGVPIFCLPGDGGAARLGLEEIILSEVHHLVDLAREKETEEEHDPSADRTEPDDDAGPDGDAEPDGDVTDADAGSAGEGE